jgi:hypothetical protein
MPMPVRHLRHALHGTACHVACGALLPPNARPTPQSCPAISPVSTSCMPVYAGRWCSSQALAGLMMSVLGSRVAVFFCLPPWPGPRRGEPASPAHWFSVVLTGPVDPATIDGMPEFLRKANQLAELMILTGPGDEDVGILRLQYGYRPEATIEVEASRLEWESSYVDLLADHPASRVELRVRLQARELLHEHLAMYTALTSEYRINLSREVGYNPHRPNVSRRRLVSFGDTIPSLRIAVDLKVELFRNASKPWTMNAIHDIDALSMAVPYCHVVVPDREMTNLLSRSGAGPRHGTKIITTLSELPDALPELVEKAQYTLGDRTGWDWAGPWDGYCLDWNDLRKSAPNKSSAGPAS